MPRHKLPLTDHSPAPLPAERIAATAFVFDPHSGRVICPWGRHVLWQDEETALCAVLDQVSAFGAALRRPCWLFSDGRPPQPIEAEDPRGWVQRWSQDRACYVARG
jgi:hypothetical protein